MASYKVNTLLTMLLLFGSIVLIVGCKDRGFYEYSRTGDVYRLPLLEPYEATSYSYGSNWFFELPFNLIKDKLHVNGIKLIGIKNNIIIIYTERTDLTSDMTEAWFIINLVKKTEKFFTLKGDYENELRREQIETVRLYDIKVLFKDFDEQGKLPLEWKNNPAGARFQNACNKNRGITMNK